MIVVLFSGADGWAEGMRMLAPDLHAEMVGFEVDPWACRTAVAAGHRVIRHDVERWPNDLLYGPTGLIASPPCQAFSAAGKGDGRALVAELAQAAAEGRTRPDLPVGVRLVLEPTRWIETCRPRWIALEQVPSVLPIWEGYRWWLRTLGYSTWSGVLTAANYGVPQTRKRAILLASLDRAVSAPPTTHTEIPGMLGAAPWVSMEDALGWGFSDRPARTVCGNRQPRWLYDDNDGTHGVVLDRRTRSKGAGGSMYPTPPVDVDRPAPTLTVQGVRTPAVWRDGDEERLLDTTEALILQSFPADYPVSGDRTARSTQIGNAMPPRLAAHVLAEVLGRELDLPAPAPAQDADPCPRAS